MSTVIYITTLCLLVIPFLLYFFSLTFRKGIPSPKTTQDPFSILLICHNEDLYIEDKIRELLREGQLTGRTFELIAISDGSTDNTNKIILSLNEKYQELTPIILSTRKGKANAINIAVSTSQFDLLVFSDARQTIQEGSIDHLLKPLALSNIGAVSSVLKHKYPSPLRKGINTLKLREGKAASTSGVYGALFSMKKSLFTPLDFNTILDDLQISIDILSQGKRIITNRNAIITDKKIEHYYTPFRIKRIIAGLLQSIRKNIYNYHKIKPKVLLFLFIQKYFKLILPFLLLISTLSAIFCPLFNEAHFWILLVSICVLLLKPKGLRNLIYFNFVYLSSIGTYKQYENVIWNKLQ